MMFSVGESADAVEHVEEGLQGLVPGARQVAGTDQGTGVGIVVEALGQFQRCFGDAHDLADSDFLGRPGQSDTATATANGFQIPFPFLS